MCAYSIFLFKRLFFLSLSNELFNQTMKIELLVLYSSKVTHIYTRTHMHMNVHTARCELSQAYTVMHYMQHLHYHPMRFPHPSLQTGP